MNELDRRGEYVAGLGMVVSLAGFIALLFLATSHLSLATYAAAWQLLGAAGIWVLILIRIHQGRLLEQERRDLEELERERRARLGGAGTIFEEKDAEQMEALSMGRRLRTIEKWFIPIFAAVTAIGLAGVGLRFLLDTWPWSLAVEAAGTPVRRASMIAFVCGGMAFVTFALSRYALGMSRVREGGDWTALRAGGVFFFGNSVALLATAVALVLAHNGYDWPERRLAVALGVVLVLLAVEIVVNFVLDFYRPRVAGELQRAFYESRLLGVFCEPEGIIRNVAHTIDYQFGFKVSETWFYQFLQSKIVPLIIFQVAVIYAVTCFVVVPQGHKAVVEVTLPRHIDRWVAESGIHFTWPWPWARATLVPVERVRRMELGYDPTKEKPSTEPAGRETILWTQRHRVAEYRLLVADRGASADTKVPVNLVSVTMPVHWRVRADRVLDFYRQTDDVEKLIRALAYQALTRYAAHADLMELIGSGGIRAAQEVRASLQAACDRAGVGGGGLGVEIVYVGLGGVHPPIDVAEAYERVVNAFEQRDTKILQGEKAALKTQIEAAGEAYAELFEAIEAEERARAAGSPDADELGARVQRLLRETAGGESGEIASLAAEYLYQRVTSEGASAELFRVQRAAYEQSPRVYTHRMYLRAISEGLRDVRKYIVAVRHPDRVLYQLDLKPPPPLEVLQQEIRSFQEGGGQ